jgi:hypothetical protein
MPDVNKIEIDIDEVVEAWGDYYLNSGQNMENLHMLPFEEYDTQTAGTVIETDQTVLREANVEVQEILQQYQDDFTSKGGVTMKPVNIFLQNIKIDVGVIPHKLIKAWTGFLTNSGNNPETYPFIAWLVEQYLLKQGKEDFELKSVYKGVFEAPVAGTAGEAAKVVDGIEICINRALSTTDTEVFDLGDLDALSAKDFVTKLEDYFVKAIPEKYRYNLALELSMSRTYRDKFRQGMNDKYNIAYAQTEQLTRFRFFENVSVEGRASMINKTRIWTTPKFNLLFPVKGFSNKSAFDVQKQDRKIKFLTDWWQGVGFVQNKLIWTSAGEVPDSIS